MRRYTNVRAAEASPENMATRMPRVYSHLKATTASSIGREDGVSGGVFASSAYEEDGPVTREALSSPAEKITGKRRPGDQAPDVTLVDGMHRRHGKQ